VYHAVHKLILASAPNRKERERILLGRKREDSENDKQVPVEKIVCVWIL